MVPCSAHGRYPRVALAMKGSQGVQHDEDDKGDVDGSRNGHEGMQEIEMDGSSILPRTIWSWNPTEGAVWRSRTLMSTCAHLLLEYPLMSRRNWNP